MAEYTKKLGLLKDAEEDFYDVHKQNENLDMIDEAIEKGEKLLAEANKQ